MNACTFSIAHWQGWAAGLADSVAWQQWARTPFCPLADNTDQSLGVALDFLPAMQRRRLSPLARGLFACTWPLAQDAQGRSRALPLVFASRYGETQRSFQLLCALAADEALSPTAFCLSVHNAMAAQWSILRGDTSESVALSAEDDGLEHAFLEAGLLLHAGHEEVLVVLAEERPPAAYAPWVADVPFSYVLAFRLCAGQDWRLTWQAATPDAPAQARAPGSGAPAWPNPLSLARHLLLGTRHWEHRHAARSWHWGRLTTGPSASLDVHVELKRGGPGIEPQAPPKGGAEAAAAKPEFFT